MATMTSFFGEGNYEFKTNKYFTFNGVKSEDEVIIFTSNILYIKGSYVMAIGNNKAIYLKDWQIVDACSYYGAGNGWLVKINKNYFKPYTFKTEFEDFYFEKDQTFEDLKEVAKEQTEAKLEVRFGRIYKN